MSGLTKRYFTLLDSIISASNHTNASRYVIKKVGLNLPLLILIYILMSIIKNCITIRLQLV